MSEKLQCPACYHSISIHKDTNSGWNCEGPDCACPMTPEKIRETKGDV